MVITITIALELPATTILELFWDLPPVPVVGQPAEGRCTIGSIDLECVEAGTEAKGAESQRFPESDPLDNSTVFIDGLSLFEVECGIGVHGGSLNEWLELITGMGWCSFNTNDSFDRLLSQDRVAQTASNVREFLVISPLDFPLVTSIVIIMRGSSSIILSLLEVDLLGLREPRSCGLSPSVIELKVNVVQMAVRALSMGDLVVPSRDVALLV